MGRRIRGSDVGADRDWGAGVSSSGGRRKGREVERPVRHAKGESRRTADGVRGFIANDWASGLGSAALHSHGWREQYTR